jgi:hypothetical protein
VTSGRADSIPRTQQQQQLFPSVFAVRVFFSPFLLAAGHIDPIADVDWQRLQTRNNE